MTAAADQFTQFAHRGQEAISGALRVWQDALRATPMTLPTGEGLSEARAAVDAAFDFADRVLADQREFTKAVVSVSTRTVETLVEQATRFAEQTAGAVQDRPLQQAAPAAPATPTAVVAVPPRVHPTEA